MRVYKDQEDPDDAGIVLHEVVINPACVLVSYNRFQKTHPHVRFFANGSSMSKEEALIHLGASHTHVERLGDYRWVDSNGKIISQEVFI